MLRKLLAVALGLGAFTLAAMAAPETDKKSPAKAETKTLEGNLVCTKCNLAETDKCGNALVVKDGDKDVTYYLNDKGAKDKYHVCSGKKPPR